MTLLKHWIYWNFILNRIDDKYNTSMKLLKIFLIALTLTTKSIKKLNRRICAGHNNEKNCHKSFIKTIYFTFLIDT